VHNWPSLTCQCVRGWVRNAESVCVWLHTMSSMSSTASVASSSNANANAKRKRGDDSSSDDDDSLWGGAGDGLDVLLDPSTFVPLPVQDTTAAPAFSPDYRTLGKQCPVAVPPRLSLGGANGWLKWSREQHDASFRPCRLMCFNLPLDLLQKGGGGQFLRDFATFTDPVQARRSIAFATLVSILGVTSKGYFVEGQRLCCESELPDD
jgi:hypothetical protein